MNIEDLCKNLKRGTIAYIFIFTHLFVSVCEASACRAIVLIHVYYWVTCLLCQLFKLIQILYHLTSWYHLYPLFSISARTLLPQVFFGCPIGLFPVGSSRSACQVILEYSINMYSKTRIYNKVPGNGNIASLSIILYIRLVYNMK